MRFTSIFLLALLPFLASCMDSPDKSDMKGDTASSQGAGIISYTETIEKASSKIKDTPEFEKCMLPSVNMCISQVGNQLARTQKSVAFCDEMPEASSKDACKYGVIISQVTEMKNIDLCNSLSETYKRECRIGYFMSEAITLENTEKCNAISNETLSQSGVVDTQIDRAEQCRSNVIMRKTDAKITDCDVLKEGQSKDMCIAIMKNRLQPGRNIVRPVLPAGVPPESLN